MSCSRKRSLNGLASKSRHPEPFLAENINQRNPVDRCFRGVFTSDCLTIAHNGSEQRATSRRRSEGSSLSSDVFPGRELSSTSPLTFQGLGVEPSHRLSTWGDTSSLQNDEDGNDANSEHLAPDGPVLDDEHLDPAGAVTAATVVAGPSQVGESSPTRKRAASVDSDDLDAMDAVEQSKVPPGPLKPVGHFMLCGECTNKFTVVSPTCPALSFAHGQTAYTKEHPKSPMTWLCVKCCTKLGIDPFAKASKPKAVKKAKKEDRGKIVHYEQRKGVNPLGDMCIHMIGKYIEDVDQLGDIGGVNMDKVCKIISKSRRLTPETAPLFYSAQRTDLDLYDCTRESVLR